MINRFGFRRKAVDKLDRLRKVRERVLFVDRIGIEDPAVKGLHTPLRFRP